MNHHDIGEGATKNDSSELGIFGTVEQWVRVGPQCIWDTQLIPILLALLPESSP
jgi:hypothetical protein